MGRNRGSKKMKKGKFAWKSRKANRGRKGAQGKRKHFLQWPEVRAQIRRRATNIIVPEKSIRDAAKAEAAAADAAQD